MIRWSFKLRQAQVDVSLDISRTAWACFLSRSRYPSDWREQRIMLAPVPESCLKRAACVRPEFWNSGRHAGSWGSRWSACVPPPIRGCWFTAASSPAIAVINPAEFALSASLPIGTQRSTAI